jgi:hypothetical protein
MRGFFGQTKWASDERGFQAKRRGVTKWVSSACAGALVERDVRVGCEGRGEGVKSCTTLRCAANL